jgi:CMP-N,N'-diacetyllegionaminic acid synthase
MIDKESVLAFIPARGGSKTVPRKNVRLLGGKPLLAWPIETAFATPEIDRIVVSTDDAEIATVAKQYGAELHSRPAVLAGDASLVIDAIRHFKQKLKEKGHTIKIMVLLEATSPFRTSEMVSKCLRRLVNEDLDSIATFSESDISPERLWRINDGIPSSCIEGAVPWEPRQSFMPAYKLNAAVYAFRLDRMPETGSSILFGKFGAEVTPSDNLIDIDNEKDFLVANAILKTSNLA